MGKLFIFGFNQDAPRGGMLDLLTDVDLEATDFGPSVITQDMTISPTYMAAVVAGYDTFSHYQVVHMDCHGGILMVEHWKRAHFFALPSAYELLTGAIFEDAKGDYVRRESIQQDCRTSVGYAPG